MWFSTVVAMPAVSVNDGCFLYYGHGGAAAAPSDPHEVFVFYDGFEAGDLSGWQADRGGLWTASTDASLNGSYALRAPPAREFDYRLIAEGVETADVSLTSYWRFSDVTELDAAQLFRVAAVGSAYETNIEGPAGWDIAQTTGSAWTELLDQPSGQTPAADQWVKVETQIFGQRMRVLIDGAQVVPPADWLDVGDALRSGSIGFRTYSVKSGHALWVDDVVLRDLVDPEPVVELQDEQPSGCIGN